MTNYFKQIENLIENTEVNKKQDSIKITVKHFIIIGILVNS